MNSNLINNYLYMYHTNQFILLPTFPESIQDSLSASFSSTNPLSRSAPIFTYSNSGPRSVQVNLSLHREMMNDINTGISNLTLDIGSDYIDTLVKQIQAIALPKYSAASKLVNPPMIAIRFGNSVYIKGVVNGGITITYSGPILQDNKYALINISFAVYEVDPYDAESVQISGSMRGLSTSLERRLYK